MTERKTAESAVCNSWGSSKNARRVSGLTKTERAEIRAGAVYILTNCPAVRGITERRIVARGGRFYCRMP